MGRQHCSQNLALHSAPLAIIEFDSSLEIQIKLASKTMCFATHARLVDSGIDSMLVLATANIAIASVQA